jgi:hypothetical protein
MAGRNQHEMEFAFPGESFLQIKEDVISNRDELMTKELELLQLIAAVNIPDNCKPED